MKVNIKTMAAVGALAIAVAACGGETGGEDPVETSPTSTSQPSATTTSTEPTTATTTTAPPSTTTTTVAVRSLEDVVGVTAADPVGWLVQPGRYDAEFNGFRVEFEVSQPIRYLDGEGRLDFAAEPKGGSDLPEWVRLGTFVGVIPAEMAGVHAPHEPVVPPHTADLPEDLGEYLETVPQLVVEEVGQIEGQGFKARAWNVSVDPAQGNTFSCFLGSCVSALVSEFGGVYVFGSAAAARVWQLDGPGEGVYGYLQSPPEDFENTVAIAEMILESLSFENSG